MRRRAAGLCAALVLSGMAGCSPGWKHGGGAVVLPDFHSQVSAGRAASPDAPSPGAPVAGKAPPRPIALSLPAGWHWFMRVDDFVATRDGVFLQNIFVERIHVDQVEQPVLGTFWLAAFSSKQWPLRTVESLGKRFVREMPAADAAEALLGSRRNDPAVADLEVREVAEQEIAGNRAFRAVYDFRLKDPGPRTSYRDTRLRSPARTPTYRSVYYGFVRGEWFYGISYTAARRHYFPKDAGAFESVLRSVALGGD